MKIKCPHCKYEWDTNSKLDAVTCPNCQKKFKKFLQSIKKAKKGETIIYDEATI